MLVDNVKKVVSLQSDYLTGKHLEPHECCVNSCAFGRVRRLVNQHSNDTLMCRILLYIDVRVSII